MTQRSALCHSNAQEAPAKGTRTEKSHSRRAFRLRLNTPEELPHMDAYRFDTLTRSLAVPSSRRRTISALIGSLGLLALVDRDEAAAAKSGKCKPKCGECARCKRGDCDKKKGRKKRCKRGKCQPLQDGTPCTGGVCGSGFCTATPICPPPFTVCNGFCVNTRANEANCGGCGIVCTAGLSCCRGSCTSRNTDPTNCGRCGNICPATAPVCQAGACVVGP
jgi:Stigma-specific protein, Stig1